MGPGVTDESGPGGRRIMNAGNNHFHTHTSLFFSPHSLATAFQNTAGEGGEQIMGMEAGEERWCRIIQYLPSIKKLKSR